HLLGPDEGLGRFGAPPVELLAPGTPVAAFPFPYRGGDVAVVISHVVASQGQLPAHLGLVVEKAHAPFLGSEVERATRAGREPGTIQEDAGAIGDTGHRTTAGSRPGRTAPFPGDRGVLPFGIVQGRRGALH